MFGRKQKDGVFIVAEISANHGKSYKTATALIKEAKACGADAVKFQTYTPDTITVNSKKRYFMVKHPKWGGQPLYSLYQKAFTPWEWFRNLKKIADDLDIVFFSTAFDKTAVDFLEGLDVPVHKIASFELPDLPLIEYMAKTGKPIIMSTGMSTIGEIKEAVSTAKNAGAKDVMLLKCISSYPAQPQEMNLRTMPDMKKRFHCSVGLSDHTLSIGASIAAVSLGVEMIEKHFTLSRKDKSPDSFFSIEPQELKALVNNVRIAEKALGRVTYGPSESEGQLRRYRRSLFVTEDIKRGSEFTQENIRSIRPADGLEPKYLNKILGKKAKADIKKNTPLSRDLIKK